jgi:hypothetical protein
VKSNLGVLASSVAFELESAAVQSGVEVETACLREVGPSPFSAQELLALNEPEMRSKAYEAETLLRAELEHGPRLVSELRAAAKEQGISITTLERAKKQVGAESVKLNLHEWAWQLPPGEQEEDEPAAA